MSKALEKIYKPNTGKMKLSILVPILLPFYSMTQIQNRWTIFKACSSKQIPLLIRRLFSCLFFSSPQRIFYSCLRMAQVTGSIVHPSLAFDVALRTPSCNAVAMISFFFFFLMSNSKYRQNAEVLNSHLEAWSNLSGQGRPWTGTNSTWQPCQWPHPESASSFCSQTHQESIYQLLWNQKLNTCRLWSETPNRSKARESIN